MGKTITVGPTETLEELTAEQLSATDLVVYHDAPKAHDTLRAQIGAAGISRVAPEAAVSRSIVKAIVNQVTVPQRSTLAKTRPAPERLVA